jgi:hypothetical protein
MSTFTEIWNIIQQESPQVYQHQIPHCFTFMFFHHSMNIKGSISNLMCAISEVHLIMHHITSSLGLQGSNNFSDALETFFNLKIESIT